MDRLRPVGTTTPGSRCRASASQVSELSPNGLPGARVGATTPGSRLVNLGGRIAPRWPNRGTAKSTQP